MVVFIDISVGFKESDSKTGNSVVSFPQENKSAATKVAALTTDSILTAEFINMF